MPKHSETDTTMSAALQKAKVITTDTILERSDKDKRLSQKIAKKKLQHIAETYAELSEGEKVKSEPAPGEKVVKP